MCLCAWLLLRSEIPSRLNNNKTIRTFSLVPAPRIRRLTSRLLFGKRQHLITDAISSKVVHAWMVSDILACPWWVMWFSSTRLLDLRFTDAAYHKNRWRDEEEKAVSSDLTRAFSQMENAETPNQVSVTGRGCSHTMTSCYLQTCLSTTPTSSHTHARSSASPIPITAVLWQTRLAFLRRLTISLCVSHTDMHIHANTVSETSQAHCPTASKSRDVQSAQKKRERESTTWQCIFSASVKRCCLSFLLPLILQWTRCFPLLSATGILQKRRFSLWLFLGSL